MAWLDIALLMPGVSVAWVAVGDHRGSATPRLAAGLQRCFWVLLLVMLSAPMCLVGGDTDLAA